MTFEEWSALSYTEQKTALVEAVLFLEEWDWASHETLLDFFENSPEVDITVRRFVDIAHLRDLFGSADLDDCVDDMGMDNYQYVTFRQRLFSGLDKRLFESYESAELLLLDSVNAVFVTRELYRIMAYGPDGELVMLRLSRRCFTDGRDDEEVLPWAEQDDDDQFDQCGEWLQVDCEQTERSYDIQDVIDSIPDIDVVDDVQLGEALASIFADHTEGDEFEIPQYQEGVEDETRGLGDKLFE
jgi:hypothetical protein